MAAGATYTPIETQTLTSSTTTVTFSNISGSYTDLILIYNGNATGQQGYRTRVGNGSIDTGTNYSETYIGGDGSSASSGKRTGYGAFVDPTIFATPNTIITNFMNYSNTSTYKTLLWRYNNTAGEVGAQIGLWRSTSAINIIDVTAYTKEFTAGSTFTLYGIAAA